MAARVPPPPAWTGPARGAETGATPQKGNRHEPHDVDPRPDRS